MSNHIHSSDYEEEDIYLNTSDIGLDILVKGSHQAFQEFIADKEKNSFDKNAIIIKRVWGEIKKATKDGTDKIYEVEPAWSNLCDDIFIFYALRWILFNKPVPIVKPSFAEQALAKSIPDPCEVQE